MCSQRDTIKTQSKNKQKKMYLRMSKKYEKNAHKIHVQLY